MTSRTPANRAGTKSAHGTLADRYRLDELLGRGGTADVYRGTDLRLGRPVAVKIFRPGADAVFEERFRDEAVLLARLHHPGLVTVYDAGRYENHSYLVMQLVRGTTLRQQLATAPMTPQSAARLGVRLAGALAHVHAAGIVHRDVKPSNILLDADDRPYLTDFGISRLIDATSNTVPGALIGTAAYLAPEQVLGTGAGPAADVYALGLVLLECLKGELEYSGPPLEAAIARLHRPPDIPSHVPTALAGLLRDMTSKDETARPDARECAAALTDISPDPDPDLDPDTAPAGAVHRLAGEGDEAGDSRLSPGPVTTREETPQRPAKGSGVRRTRTLLVSGTALAALLGAVLTTTALLPGGTGGQEAPTPRPPESAPHTAREPSAGPSAPGPVRHTTTKPSAAAPADAASSSASHGQGSQDGQDSQGNQDSQDSQGSQGNQAGQDSPESGENAGRRSGEHAPNSSAPRKPLGDAGDERAQDSGPQNGGSRENGPKKPKADKGVVPPGDGKRQGGKGPEKSERR
ncbi:protein kinase domain-containing protein [Streptomyces sp. NPDC003016]